uniref:ABC transporter domain-containing protein n=1 Tax=Syphacia muris TaxID=451379 RepID=A0A158R4F2_9BILA
MGKHRLIEQNYTFGLTFFKKLCVVSRLLFSEPWRPTFFILATIGISIGNEFAGYYVGLIAGKMYGALLAKDKHRFWYVFYTGSLMYIGKCLIAAFVSLSSWLLYLTWRKNAVTELERKYFSKKAYYKLNCIDDQGIDNPDQRITQDVERMTNQLATNIMPNVLIGPFVVAWYTWKTWATAGPLGAAICYVYYIVGTVVNKFLMSPMTKWSARVERAEGDFRYKHVSVRLNAESSAFYNAEGFEETQSNKLLATLLRKQFFFYIWKFPNFFWQQSFDYYGAIVSYLIQIIPIFINDSYADMDAPTLATTISNNAFRYIMLINSFTRVTDVALSAGEAAGILQRYIIITLLNYVADFVTAADEIDDDDDGDANTFDAMLIDSKPNKQRPSVLFRLENVTYSLPTLTFKKESAVYGYDLHRLVTGLNLTIKANENILVTGTTGIGKSSFFRVLGNLWKIDSGKIQRYIDQNMILQLPQKPYFPSGYLSLWQQISFPTTVTDLVLTSEEFERINAILSLLKLEKVVARCGTLDASVDFEWQDTLTPGEQQRLSFARLLYHKPIFVILDEATSSVDIDMEKLMYEQLKKEGITYMSAGHRPALASYHDYQLHFSGDSRYTFRKIDGNAELDDLSLTITL